MSPSWASAWGVGHAGRRVHSNQPRPDTSASSAVLVAHLLFDALHCNWPRPWHTNADGGRGKHVWRLCQGRSERSRAGFIERSPVNSVTATARKRAARVLPVILGFEVGCILGAATERTFGVRRLALIAVSASLAFVIALAIPIR